MRGLLAQLTHRQAAIGKLGRALTAATQDRPQLDWAAGVGRTKDIRSLRAEIGVPHTGDSNDLALPVRTVIDLKHRVSELTHLIAEIRTRPDAPVDGQQHHGQPLTGRQNVGMIIAMDLTASMGARLLRITVVDDRDRDALQSLFDWLRLEDELRGRLRLEASRSARPGEMGALLDVLTVALGSGGVGAVLASSLSAWFSQRRAEVKVVLTRDGRSVEVDARVAKDELPGLMREIGRLVDGPEQQG
ncbi:hypothetical protein ACIQF6_17390 [Kitasatospora sp. NPDC092948]|uniref:effector-associated constant component EACC1 n=1 Tax=Kitasatospora sp. NPDC092948 TaxID=3364088 RepID=UPI0038271135